MNFLFSDKESTIQLVTPSSPETRGATSVQTSRAFPSKSTPQIELPSETPSTTSESTEPSKQLTKVNGVLAQSNNDAQALVIPIIEIAPSLQSFIQDANPNQHVSTDLATASGLVSFYLSGAQRDPTLKSSSGVPLHVVQRVFVHIDDKGASMMYDLLINEATPSYAKAAVEFFEQPYPNLQASSRSTSQFNISEENHLLEIRIDPQMSVEERLLGPGNPHVYYLTLRQGRATTLIELFYLNAQDPDSVASLGQRFVQRVKNASHLDVGV
jgi:hypothetical protein